VDLVSGTSRLISLAGSVPGMINRIVTVDVQGTNQVVAKMAEDGRLLVSSPEGARGEGTVRVVIETTDGANHTVGFPVSTMPMPRVTMTYVGKPGSNVFVAGSFNGWTPSRDRLADDDGDGTYEGTFPVAPGSYAYKFVVDGNWMLD